MQGLMTKLPPLRFHLLKNIMSLLYEIAQNVQVIIYPRNHPYSKNFNEFYLKIEIY